MKSNNFLNLIIALMSGQLFINNLTPGALTTEEMMIDVVLIGVVFVCIIFNKRLGSLASKHLPFLEPLLDTVEKCCNDVNCKNEAEAEPVEEELGAFGVKNTESKEVEKSDEEFDEHMTKVEEECA